MVVHGILLYSLLCQRLYLAAVWDVVVLEYSQPRPPWSRSATYTAVKWKTTPDMKRNVELVSRGRIERSSGATAGLPLCWKFRALGWGMTVSVIQKSSTSISIHSTTTRLNACTWWNPGQILTTSSFQDYDINFLKIRILKIPVGIPYANTLKSSRTLPSAHIYTIWSQDHIQYPPAQKSRTCDPR